MAIPGFFGGGMIAVLVAKIVGWVSGCAPQEGMPACNFEPYLAVGAVLGALLLPGMVLWRLRGGRRLGDRT